MYYPNALGPKGSEWSYLIPLASLTVLAAYYVCGTVSSMLSGLKTRSLGLNTLGTT